MKVQIFSDLTCVYGKDLTVYKYRIHTSRWAYFASIGQSECNKWLYSYT